MRPLSHATLAVVLLAGCNESGVLDTYEVPTLDLDLASPTYGMFAGDGPTIVKGTVTPSNALLRVEGQVVTPRADGSFEVRVPFGKPYRIIDVSADAYDQHAEARVPVFAGFDPLETWPGAVTLRLTPRGLDGLGALLEGVVGDLLGGLAGAGGLPAFDVAGWQIGISGVTIGDTDVELGTRADALAASFVAKDVTLDVAIQGDLFGNPITIPGALTFPTIGIGLDLGVDVDDTGTLLVTLGEPTVDFDTPELSLAGGDLSWLSDLLVGAIDLEALLQDQLAQLVGQGGAIPIAGPIAFETDALGTSLAFELTDAATDKDGVALALGVGIDGPVPDSAADVPVPKGDFPQPVDLAVGVHDGLLQLLLESDLLSLLEQDITIPGFLGGFLDPLISNLPGGGTLPEHDGWCVRLAPGDAKVARFGVGSGPLAGIYLPDTQVTFSTLTPGSGICEPWLATSLALEVYLGVSDGTKIDLGIEVPEGVVLDYGGGELSADEEVQLVAQLGGLLGTLLDLVGGFTSFDLQDLLGGLGGGVGGLPLDGLDLQIRNARPLRDAEGQPVEGMVELGVQLF